VSASARGFAFICLLRDDLEARGLAGLLESLARSSSEVAFIFLVPQVRGLDFFAASARQTEVDRWWGHNVPPSFVPVYLICHEEGLAGWLRGVDGVAMVAANERSRAAYKSWTVVDAEPGEAPLALAEAAIMRFGAPKASAQPTLADIFDRRDARMVAGLRSDPSLGGRARPKFPPLVHVDGIRADTSRSGSAAAPDPTDVLDAESGTVTSDPTSDGGGSEAKQVIDGRSGPRHRLQILKKRTGGPAVTDAEIPSRVRLARWRRR
jgi:hypothetical protein